MTRYPWSTLGIEKTLDERSIKSAYAQRLKSTRPEDDPSAFQALVEARNDALAIAKRAGRKKPRKPHETTVRRQPATETQKREPAVAVRPRQSLAPIVAGAAENSAARRNRSAVPPKLPARQVVAPIVTFLGPFGEEDKFEAARQAVEAVCEGPLGLRVEVEPILLEAVVFFLLPHTRPPSATGLPENRQRDGYIIVALLDEEFGWSDNITHLSKLTSDAKELTSELQIVRYGKERISSSQVMPIWTQVVGKIVLFLFTMQVIFRIANFLLGN